MKKTFKSKKGQALISLLFIVLIGITIISMAAILAYVNFQAASVTEQGTYAYYIAESGAEEGLLRLIRDPSYSGTPLNQPISISSGTSKVTVSNGTITSIGTYNAVIRKIQVQTVYNNGVRTITSWREI